MSCIDVVYQSLERHPFFHHANYKNSEDNINDDIRAQDLSIGVKVEEEESDASGSDKESIPEAEYVSAKCVIFTYFTGDTNKVVDDHFSKALNRPSSFSRDAVIQTTEESTTNDINNNNNGPLMSQRIFPPSFWSSDYYIMKRNNNPSDMPTSIQEGVFGDTSVVTNRPDAWQYRLTQSAYGHRPITEVGYGVDGAVFNPRYSSLLIQPPVTASRLPGFESQCDYTKPPSDPGWSIAYTNPHAEYSSYAGVENGVNAQTALMTDNQDSNKDPFWF